MNTDTILKIGLEIALLFAVPLITSAIYRVLNKLADYLHIHFTAAQEAQLNAIAADAAEAAEEWAAQKIKSGQTKPTSDDKLNVAVTHLTEHLPGLDPKHAISMIKSVLPKLGLGAAFSVLKKAL
jgi:hypothetical protein